MSISIRFEERASDIRVVHIENEWAVASISLFGGQLLSWRPRSASQPVLWMSPLARFDGKTAIRGGVPICWPWFGKHPSSATAPSHGYARLSTWELERIEALPDGRSEVVLVLPGDMQSGEHCHPGLGNAVRMVIGEGLDIESTTRNETDSVLQVTEGLHTYFQISDVGHVRVTGLSGSDYVDLVDGNRLCRQEGAIGLGEEVGRIFVHCDKVATIEDPGFRRRIEVSSQGARSLAVWNPGAQVAGTMADLGGEHWRGMVCVETANALEDRLTLAPGGSHTLVASYRVLALDA